MEPNYSDDQSLAHRLALGPFLIGIVLCIFGIVALFNPILMLKIIGVVFVVLLALGCLSTGIGMILHGLHIYRNWPEMQRRMRVERWVFWKNND
ncbi:MAG: hypothetical protein ACOCVL_02715 [Candidatus Sumerlaeota bacterium]